MLWVSDYLTLSKDASLTQHEERFGRTYCMSTDWHLSIQMSPQKQNKRTHTFSSHQTAQWHVMSTNVTLAVHMHRSQQAILLYLCNVCTIKTNTSTLQKTYIISSFAAHCGKDWKHKCTLIFTADRISLSLIHHTETLKQPFYIFDKHTHIPETHTSHLLKISSTPIMTHGVHTCWTLICVWQLLCALMLVPTD